MKKVKNIMYININIVIYNIDTIVKIIIIIINTDIKMIKNAYNINIIINNRTKYKNKKKMKNIMYINIL